MTRSLEFVSRYWPSLLKTMSLTTVPPGMGINPSTWMPFESTINISPLELPTYISSPFLSNVAAVGVKGGEPSENLRELGKGTLPLSDAETGRTMVLPVFKSTRIGAEERGHAKHTDGMDEPG